MTRIRAMGAVVIVCGAVLVAVTYSERLFSAAPAIEALTDDFRGSFTPESVATARADIAALLSAAEELQERGPQVLAPAVGVRPDQVSDTLAQRYPDVAAGLAEIPVVAARFNGLVDLLEANRVDFSKADAVPTESLPATMVPWQVLVSGLLLVGLGAWIMVRPGRLPCALCAGAALLLVLSTVALSLPDKARATARLTSNTRDVFTVEQAAAARDAVVTLGAMGSQLTGELLPDVAAGLGVSVEAAQQQIGSQLPAVGAALGELDGALARFIGLADALEDNLSTYTKAAEPDLSTVVTLQLWLGVVCLAAAAAGFAFATYRQRQRRADQPPVLVAGAPLGDEVPAARAADG